MYYEIKIFKLNYKVDGKTVEIWQALVGPTFWFTGFSIYMIKLSSCFKYRMVNEAGSQDSEIIRVVG